MSASELHVAACKREKKEKDVMSKRTFWIVLATAVAGIGWFAFRPERLIVNKTVSESFPASAAPSAVAAGKFHGVAHATRGTATVYRLPDGTRTLRLTDFETSNGPDVQLYLVAAADASDNETVTKAGFLPLGALKGNVGDQNYEIPDAADLGRYRAVTVWCRRFGVNFATAPLAASTAASLPRGEGSDKGRM
jgi:hypothetical protein